MLFRKRPPTAMQLLEAALRRLEREIEQARSTNRVVRNRAEGDDDGGR